MRVIILADDLGTRISEESHLKPKLMIETGGKPTLWHIMRHYSEYEFHEFIICLGYKQYVVKKFFADYFLHTSDVTLDLASNKMEVHNNYSRPRKMTLVNTGLNTIIGGRMKRIERYMDREPFVLAYGDGVSNVDLQMLLKSHQNHGEAAIITTVDIGQLKGVLDIGEDSTVHSFREKEDSNDSLINGGFMVMSLGISDYLKDDTMVFEKEPVQQLVQVDELVLFRHDGLWRHMDTQREMQKLESLWQPGNVPWRVRES